LLKKCATCSTARFTQNKVRLWRLLPLIIALRQIQSLES